MKKQNVSERAVFQRLNRSLARAGLVLRRCRAASWFVELGELYCVNRRTNFVEAKHVNLEAWAREAGVLHENEAVTG